MGAYAIVAHGTQCLSPSTLALKLVVSTVSLPTQGQKRKKNKGLLIIAPTQRDMKKCFRHNQHWSDRCPDSPPLDRVQVKGSRKERRRKTVPEVTNDRDERI